MPTELLAIPPAYTIVGLYRLLTDKSIRDPVWDKVKHAAVRGAVVGALYASLGWKIMDWAVRKFVVRGRAGERVTLGHGRLSISIDFVLYSHLLILLPQLGAIMHFFVKKNLRIARARAHAYTVQSRGKPAEFWSQGYVEEWASPPVQTSAAREAWNGRVSRQRLIRLALRLPVQIVIKNLILVRLSPSLPLIIPLYFASLRALQTAEYLHKPYFTQKHMTKDEVWRWIEERKWAYRSFGFIATLLEGLPIIGLMFSVSNRIGAAMWAHDLEKRQHLFAHGILKPLPLSKVGIFGCGSPGDITPAVVQAEKEIEHQWSSRPAFKPDAVAYDPAKPESDYPDTKPPSYDQITRPSAPSTSASASGVRLPPPLPPRHTKPAGAMP